MELEQRTGARRERSCLDWELGPQGKELVTGSHESEGDRIWTQQGQEPLKATETVEGESQEWMWSVETRRNTLVVKDQIVTLGEEQLGR